ncbi:tyrosine-type recombinase/integrase [Paraburkholderia sediminicola]|uniref:tyrosine-type recombinase/integrase n=1 Tax=Paraburkholderia sediminicola TaxID=458836 RepID=UPI0038B943CB
MKKKIFRLAPPDFEVFAVIDESTGRAVRRPAGCVPLPTWPNGHWCVELAWYCRKKAEKNLSRLDRGGTLGTYVSQLTHIVRYCYKKGITFLELDDNDFIEFVQQELMRKASGWASKSAAEVEFGSATNTRSVAAEKSEKDDFSGRKRTNRTVVNIGKRTLEFLEIIGNIYGMPSFVGTVIRAERRKYTIRGRNGPSRVTEYWHHQSFPLLSALKKCYPVSSESLRLLRAANAKIGASAFIRMRRFVLLRVLEKTGGRRIEVVDLTVSDVKKAMAMAKPKLLLNTVKQKNGEPVRRLVPIDKQDLILLDDYIETSRAVVIDRTIGSAADHGYVFISERTGQKLVANTVTLELHLLARAAGLVDKAHPHMFRHRFVMVRLQILKAEEKIADKEAFKALYVTDGWLAQRLTEETGHKSLLGLLPYIDDAFADSADVRRVTEVIESVSFATSLTAGVQELAALRGSLPPEEVAARALNLLEGIAERYSSAALAERSQVGPR